MTQPDTSNSGRRKRRWRSQQKAYEAGYGHGFLAACELIALLAAPERMKEILDLHTRGFADLIREAQSDRNESE